MRARWADSDPRKLPKVWGKCVPSLGLSPAQDCGGHCQGQCGRRDAFLRMTTTQGLQARKAMSNSLENSRPRISEAAVCSRQEGKCCFFPPGWEGEQEDGTEEDQGGDLEPGASSEPHTPGPTDAGQWCQRGRHESGARGAWEGGGAPSRAVSCCPHVNPTPAKFLSDLVNI